MEPMRPHAADTRPDAEAVQVALLRASGLAGRAARARALTEAVVALARRGIARAHPDWTEDEVAIAFVEAHYGAALAAKVRSLLARRTV